MLNFTVGPVQSSEEIRKIGYEQVPYFRTQEFSNLMFENERLMKKFSKASDESKVVFITGSGTASMEATIMNVFNENDKVIVVNGGGFGQRFVDLCNIHSVHYSEIKLEIGKKLTSDHLAEYEGKGYTGFLVNLHETSTGVLYDLDLIGNFCKRNNIFLVVDAISSFISDSIDMEKNNIGVMITGSQKALACPPGISIIVLSKSAQMRVEHNNVKSLYFDLKNALKNAERGQTPFTPAVGILRQINTRLKQIDYNGGIEKEREKIKLIAHDFRNRIKNMPFKIVSESLSNAVTPLYSLTESANRIFLILKDEYNIWICPNGGELKDKIFRVGHIGDLTIEDNDKLIAALEDMQKRNLL